MKTIPCNLTKACGIFATFTESFIKHMGIIPLNFKKFHLFIEELYIRSSISLVYVRSIEFVSILT